MNECIEDRTTFKHYIQVGLRMPLSSLKDSMLRMKERGSRLTGQFEVTDKFIAFETIDAAEEIGKALEPMVAAHKTEAIRKAFKVICDETNNDEKSEAENKLNILAAAGLVEEDRSFYKMLVKQEIKMFQLMHRTMGEPVTYKDFDFICTRRGFNADERKTLYEGIVQIKTDGWEL